MKLIAWFLIALSSFFLLFFLFGTAAEGNVLGLIGVAVFGVILWYGIRLKRKLEDEQNTLPPSDKV